MARPVPSKCIRFRASLNFLLLILLPFALFYEFLRFTCAVLLVGAREPRLCVVF